MKRSSDKAKIITAWSCLLAFLVFVGMLGWPLFVTSWRYWFGA